MHLARFEGLQSSDRGLFFAAFLRAPGRHFSRVARRTTLARRNRAGSCEAMHFAAGATREPMNKDGAIPVAALSGSSASNAQAVPAAI